MIRTVKMISDDGDLYARLDDLILVVEELADQVSRESHPVRTHDFSSLSPADGAAVAIRVVADQLRSLRDS